VSIEANIAARYHNPYTESEENPLGFGSMLSSEHEGIRPNAKTSARRNDINKSFKTTELQGHRENFDNTPDL
jgi:hypothetical protein